MIKTFLISFRLKNTYRVNTIIYSLKQIPIVKKLLPLSLYKSHGLKVFSNIISALWEIISLFLGKVFYLGIMFLFPMSFFQVQETQSFFHIFFFLTLIGGVFNTGMLSPSRDKYYAVILMKMNAREFALSNYIYTLLRHFIGFVVCFLLMSVFDVVTLPFYTIVLCPLFVCCIKLIVMQYCLYDYQKNHRVHNENNQNKYTFTFAFVMLLCAYGLLFLQVVIPTIVFIILMIVCSVIGLISFMYVFKYQSYHQLYHDLLSSVVNILNMSTTQMVNENYQKMITLDTQLSSQKSGFEYFHEIFVKRHKRLLWKSAKRQSFIVLSIVVFMFVIVSQFPDMINGLETSLTMILPYFVFIMYLMNTTKGVTQAMFVNCDHSMLTYAFYRYPQNILKLFTIRLRDMIKINLLPASLIGLGIGGLLIYVGGSDQIMNGFVSFVSILCMSIFFSTHYLIMYYLLQPFNAYTEVKNPVYSIIMSATYFVCFLFTNLQLPTLTFGIVLIAFCIAYCFISCLLVYKFAEKTFKIHD